MAIFRVEHNQNYTVMSNYHLRDKRLTLKAKGLLSQMLSLPDNWDYTLSGLAHINREGVGAVRTAVDELEKAGYLRRRQRRDKLGKMADTEYAVYEQPMCKNPITDNPVTGKPLSGNRTQLSKDEQSTDKQNIEKWKGSAQVDAPFPILSGDGCDCEQIIKENIEYDHLIANAVIDKPLLDEMVSIMVETVCSQSKTVCVAGGEYPAELVRGRFLKLDSSHMEYAADCLRANTSDIRNIKQYLRAVLFNAPVTKENFYAAKVSHDLSNSADI